MCWTYTNKRATCKRLKLPSFYLLPARSDPIWSNRNPHLSFVYADVWRWHAHAAWSCIAGMLARERWKCHSLTGRAERVILDTKKWPSTLTEFMGIKFAPTSIGELVSLIHNELLLFFFFYSAFILVLLILMYYLKKKSPRVSGFLPLTCGTGLSCGDNIKGSNYIHGAQFKGG